MVAVFVNPVCMASYQLCDLEALLEDATLSENVRWEEDELSLSDLNTIR